MKLKLLIIWLLNLFDYICTVYQVNKYGIELEANPLMRMLMAEPLIFFAVKVVLVTGLLTIMYSFRDNKICKVGAWILLIVYGALALYHIYLFLI